MDTINKVLEMAVQVTAEGITVSDLDLPDCPLIFVNGGFAQMTGYTSEETIGKNCRFLQGPETSGEAVSHIRTALTSGQRYTGIILNYRKDGSRFWNYLSLCPVSIPEHRPNRFYVGIQSDVTTMASAHEYLSEQSRLLHNKAG